MSRISGRAILAGVVGQPIDHSLSPAIHNGWLDAAGVDGTYAAFGPKDADGFNALLNAGRAGLIAGVNVTAPFKEQAFAACDRVSEAARLVKSANILVFKDGQIHGDSSDGRGVINALSEQAPTLQIEGAKVVLLGAGGASRAAAGALVTAGARVSVLNRTKERAQALADDLGGLVTVADSEAETYDADLVINALSVPPTYDVRRLKPTAVVMDMTYKPLITPFLQSGRNHGLMVVDGLAMLIGQAVPSFEAFFAQTPPSIDIRSTILTLLGEAR
ncbi:shikimate dehydrogenase [uncultured Brevundimonas sp.]|uniref:shikimate dehydrogenase n=1 Tax=uncultured Brevundimonas sp. TaxID=213418 RepID=UPI002629C176|nr:shikimate dehydrogenase [uncultured Brevundimonas sp.]